MFLSVLTLVRFEFDRNERHQSRFASRTNVELFISALLTQQIVYVDLWQNHKKLDRAKEAYIRGEWGNVWFSPIATSLTPL